MVVKPFDQGSTVGVSIVHTVPEWEEALRKAFEFDRDFVMVEEYVHGIEITVGVVLDKVLPVIEIRFPGEMFDYDAKYTHQLGETLYLCPTGKSQRRYPETRPAACYGLLRSHRRTRPDAASI